MLARGGPARHLLKARIHCRTPEIYGRAVTLIRTGLSCPGAGKFRTTRMFPGSENPSCLERKHAVQCAAIAR